MRSEERGRQTEYKIGLWWKIAARWVVAEYWLDN
jgi:hypothetical protein